MDRTTGTNNVEVDGKRQFTDGPPATTVNDDWLNAVQEEIVSLIEAGGLTPDNSDLTQLKAAIDIFILAAIAAGATNSIQDHNDGPNIFPEVYEIGPWDMNADSGATIVHGFDETRIREISANIRRDNAPPRPRPLNTGLGSNPGDNIQQGFVTNVTGGIITLQRVTGGVFDAVDYDQISFDIDNAAAVNKGGGLVGIPITAHNFYVDDTTTLAGTTNYDGTYTVVSITANEIVIEATFIPETFAGGGAETASWGRGWVTVWLAE